MIGGIYPGQVAPGAGPPPAGSRAVSAGQTVPALGTTYFGQVGGLPARGYRVISQSQSQSLTRGALLTRRVAPTQSQSLVLARPGSVLHTVTASATIGGSRGIARRFSATQSQAPALVRTVARSQALAGSQAVAVVGQVRRALALTQSQAARLAAATARIVARTQSEALARASAITHVATVTQAGQVAIGAPPTLTTFALAAAQALSIRRGFSRAQSVSAAQVPILTRQLALALALAQTSAVARTLGRTRRLTAVAAQAGALRAVVVAVRSSGQAESAALIRRIASGPSAAQAAAGSVGSATPHELAAAQAQTSVIAGVAVRPVSAAQSQSGQRTAGVARLWTAAQPSTAAFVRRIAVKRSVSEAMAPALATSTPNPPMTVALTQTQTATIAGSPRRSRAGAQSQSATRAVALARSIRAAQPAGAQLHRLIVIGRQIASSQTVATAGHVRVTMGLTAGQGFELGLLHPKQQFAHASSATVRLAALKRGFAASQDQLISPLGPIMAVVQNDHAVTLALIADVGAADGRPLEFAGTIAELADAIVD